MQASSTTKLLVRCCYPAQDVLPGITVDIMESLFCQSALTCLHSTCCLLPVGCAGGDGRCYHWITASGYLADALSHLDPTKTPARCQLDVQDVMAGITIGVIALSLSMALANFALLNVQLNKTPARCQYAAQDVLTGITIGIIALCLGWPPSLYDTFDPPEPLSAVNVLLPICCAGCDGWHHHWRHCAVPQHGAGYRIRVHTRNRVRHLISRALLLSTQGFGIGRV